MEKIETGDLLIVENSGWISKLISFVTKSKYTHSGVFCYLWGDFLGNIKNWWKISPAQLCEPNYEKIKLC
jgi:hypothetical protein